VLLFAEKMADASEISEVETRMSDIVRHLLYVQAGSIAMDSETAWARSMMGKLLGTYDKLRQPAALAVTEGVSTTEQLIEMMTREVQLLDASTITLIWRFNVQAARERARLAHTHARARGPMPRYAEPPLLTDLAQVLGTQLRHFYEQGLPRASREWDKARKMCLQLDNVGMWARWKEEMELPEKQAILKEEMAMKEAAEEKEAMEKAEMLESFADAPSWSDEEDEESEKESESGSYIQPEWTSSQPRFLCDTCPPFLALGDGEIVKTPSPPIGTLMFGCRICDKDFCGECVLEMPLLVLLDPPDELLLPPQQMKMMKKKNEMKTQPAAAEPEPQPIDPEPPPAAMDVPPGKTPAQAAAKRLKRERQKAKKRAQAAAAAT
jgi:hypothetical protein